MLEQTMALLAANGLITAFVFVGLILALSNWLSARFTRGQISEGGSRGLADISLFAGVGVLGGAMFRDFAIVATAYGAELAPSW